MTDLISLLDAAEPSDHRPLREHRVRNEASAILLFTREAEDGVLFHFEPSDEYYTFVICPGDGCPLCFLGNAGENCALLPVYNIESRAVEVLRVPKKKGVGTLASTVAALLKRRGIENEVVVLRKKRYSYFAETSQRSPGADDGAAAIAAFLAAIDSGTSLHEAFPRPTASELADLARLSPKLQAMPGWHPPTSK